MPTQQEILDHDGYVSEARTARIMKWLGGVVGTTFSLGAAVYSAHEMFSGDITIGETAKALGLASVGLAGVAANFIARDHEDSMNGGVERTSPGQS